jgi:hypothetical protein
LHITTNHNKKACHFNKEKFNFGLQKSFPHQQKEIIAISIKKKIILVDKNISPSTKRNKII